VFSRWVVERATVYWMTYYSLNVSDVLVLLTVLGCRWGGEWRINRCHMVGLEAEGSNGVCLYWAAGDGGGVLIFTVQASEGDGVATVGCGFVIATLDTPLVFTSIDISGVGGRADGTGWCCFLAKLGEMVKLAAISALSDEGS
jgi:hypothetical protein